MAQIYSQWRLLQMILNVCVMLHWEESVWQVCVCVSERATDSNPVTPHSFSLCPVVSLDPLQYTSSTSLPLCVSPSLSLPVSCALFQGWGLRHTFHLAYEALILFRARSGREEGRREGCGGWTGRMRATSLSPCLSLSPSSCCCFVFSSYFCITLQKLKRRRWVATFFLGIYYLFV